MERNDERVVRGKDGNSSTPYLDRSKVRILLCDNDAKSSKEVFTLLCKCSYQVTSVRTPRQVIDALNAEGRDIDIILAEVDLPVSKGLKLLKYIMRDEELRRIPIIMMSAQDDVSVVVKCLKHGAADYLVKPLRTNELLNLWTHMWRRRHMLGLSEKKILNFDNDLVASDPSDANTNSTTLFSDDTDEKSRRSNILENSISNYREIESNVAACAEPALSPLSEYQSSMQRLSESTGQYSSCPKKSELKIGESSAFFTYVKSSISPSKRQKNCHNEGVIPVESGTEDKLMPYSEPSIADSQTYTTNTEPENYHLPSSGTSTDITHLHRSPTPISSEIHNPRNSNEENLSTIPMHPRNDPQVNVLPYYMPHMLNPQLMMPSPSQLFQSNQQDFQRNTTVPAIIPQYNPHMPPMMTSFPYYSLCMQTGQMPSAQPWPSNGILPSTKATKTQKGERREAALMKFRQKRKDRCFDKKIRYINRKRLAERRPRVRGQFVRQVNGVDVDLNGQPVSVGDSDEDEEGDEEEELASR